MLQKLHSSFVATLLIGGFIMFSNSAQAAQETALFGGGCFWCMQPAFDQTKGVIATSVGYAGGTAEDATYEKVSTGTTAHIEAIQVTYDPAQVTYEQLLQTYLENIDPTDGDGQFADRGPQYMPVVFCSNAAQQIAAKTALESIAKKFAPQPIKVSIRDAKPFYPAEDYHQKYYQKHSLRYNAYKHGSGRASYIEKTWKKQD